MTKTKQLALSALFLALYLVLDTVRFDITPMLRLTFVFVPVALAGWLLGVLPAMCIGGLGDVLAFFWHNRGVYTPGLTISAILIGMIFGLLLHKKRISVWRVAIAQGIVTLFVHLCLDSYWLAGMFGNSAYVAFLERYIGKLLLFPILVVVIFALQKALEKATKH